jgi:hypothetical protein
MSKWASLPTEILIHIVNFLEDESGWERPYPTRWMLVCKKWFDMFLPIHYKQIKIDIDPNDKTLENILNSTYQPGAFVKNIVFETAKVPTGFSDEETRLAALDQDLLYQLIQQCPNVKDVHILSFDEASLKYFFNNSDKNQLLAIKVTPIMEEDLFSNNCSAYYFQCIYHMRNSLQELILVKGMIDGNFTCLKEFKKLTSLLIRGDDWIQDLNSCLVILENLPHLV